MKTQIGRDAIEGYYGPETSKGGKWLFVKSSKTRRSYSVARIVDGKVAELDSDQALSDYTNQEIADALIAA